MRVTKTIETKDGTFHVEAEFSKDEIDLIIEAGLSYLYQTGALPFTAIEDGEEARYLEPSKLEQ